MITSHQEYLLGIGNFKAIDENEALDRELTSVYIVSQKQIL